jgi:hypothetical protein
MDGSLGREINRLDRMGGTGVKRIRTESVTPLDSGFVPYKIWYLKTD